MGFPERVFLMPTARSRAFAWRQINTLLCLLYRCRAGRQTGACWVRYHTQPIAELTWNKRIAVNMLSSGFNRAVAYRAFPLRDTMCLFLATSERSDRVYRFKAQIRSEQRE